MDGLERATGPLNIRADVLEVRTPADFDGALLSAARIGVDALLVLSSTLITPNVHLLAKLALHHRLPAITLFPDFACAGGLLAYGPNLLDVYRQAGVMVGKVLQGVKPSELPIERPSKYEVVLNLRTAEALGLTVKPSMLLRADVVIE